MGKIILILKDSMSKRSIFRSMFNTRLKGLNIHGNALDLGSGEKAPYRNFENLKHIEITTIGLQEDRFKPDIIHDLEKKLPIEKEAFDNVFAFNILEHVYNHKQLIKETYRVLKNPGNFFAVVPFIHRIHADPNDFFRYTHSSLHNLLSESGFHDIKIEPLGFGPFTAAYAQIQPVIPKWLAIFFIPILLLSILLDKLVNKIARKYSKKENYPLGYFITAKK